MDEIEATNRLANAIHELALAIEHSNENANRVKLTVFTASTGGEIELKFNPKAPMQTFMDDLDELMNRREEILKAGQAQNAKYGVSGKKDPGAK